MMYKDGNSVNIDLLHRGPSDDRNGLEILVYLKESNRNREYGNFVEAIKNQLVYFENLYVVDNINLEYHTSIQEQFEKFNIKKYKNFYVNSLNSQRSRELSIVLGKVSYPLNLDRLSKSYVNYIENYPIALSFDIGELQVTPNREQILYSPAAIVAIEEKLDAAILEIEEVIKEQSTRDYIMFSEYKKAIEEESIVYLLGDKDSEEIVAIKIPGSKVSLTLKGEYYKPKNFLGIYHHFNKMTDTLPTSYMLDGGSIRFGKKVSLYDIAENFSKTYNVDLGSEKNILKEYIRDTFEDGSIFINLTNLDVLSIYKEYCKNALYQSTRNKSIYSSNSRKWEFDFRTAKIIAKYFLSNLSVLKKTSTDSIPKTWLEERKEKQRIARLERQKQGYSASGDFVYYTPRQSNRGGDSVTYDSNREPLKKLETMHKLLTVYGERDDTRLDTLYLHLRNRIKVVQVAPTRIKIMDDLKNHMSVETFLNSSKSKITRNIATAMYIKKNFPHVFELSGRQGINLISVGLYRTICELSSFAEKYGISKFGRFSKEQEALYETMYKVCEKSGAFNLEIMGLIKENERGLREAKLFTLFESGDRYNRTSFPRGLANLVTDYILARRLFRPDHEAVKRLRTETIYNVKPEENESN